MPSTSNESRRAGFPTTRWTLISRVRLGSEEDARRALEDLCRSYWYPIYAFTRRVGFGREDAEDVTQEFFQSLVNSDGIQEARREKGRMRSFLLAALKRVISKKLRFDTAAKRGGRHAVLVSFDEKAAEHRYQMEPAGISDPDLIFDRAWGEEVLRSASLRLRADYEKADNLSTYDMLREYLPLGENVTPYASAARKLGIAEATLRLQIHRIRKRYARLIEDQIAQTVSSPEEIKAELNHLMTVMER